MVLRVSRLMQVRNVKCLRSIVWVLLLPTVWTSAILMSFISLRCFLWRLAAETQTAISLIALIKLFVGNTHPGLADTAQSRGFQITAPLGTHAITLTGLASTNFLKMVDSILTVFCVAIEDDTMKSYLNSMLGASFSSWKTSLFVRVERAALHTLTF